MINLDQVKTLEWKVKQAVQLVVHLRRENDTLRGRLSDTEVRLQELETTLAALKANQNEMESGIRSALEELDHLEGAEAPQAVQVDPVSYPPEPATTPEPRVAVAPAPVASPIVEPVVSAPNPGVSADDRSFEEEFAALAAAEEAAQAALAEAASEPRAPVPASVELEDSPSPEETDLFDEPAPGAEEEETRPEQPGLGIF